MVDIVMTIAIVVSIAVQVYTVWIAFQYPKYIRWLAEDDPFWTVYDWNKPTDVRYWWNHLTMFSMLWLYRPFKRWLK
jgi:hypothetical protein